MLSQNRTVYFYLTAFITTRNERFQAHFSVITSYKPMRAFELVVSALHTPPFTQLCHVFVQFMSWYNNSTLHPFLLTLCVSTRHKVHWAIRNVEFFHILQITHPLTSLFNVLTTNSDRSCLIFLSVFKSSTKSYS